MRCRVFRRLRGAESHQVLDRYDALTAEVITWEVDGVTGMRCGRAVVEHLVHYLGQCRSEQLVGRFFVCRDDLGAPIV